MTMTAYQQRVNAEWLANQAPAVQAKAKELLKEVEAMQRCVYWALDPEETNNHWAASLIEHAHALLDLAHEYRAELKANPPPKTEENSDESTEDDLQSSR